jgi:hypothetical protein
MDVVALSWGELLFERSEHRTRGLASLALGGKLGITADARVERLAVQLERPTPHYVATPPYELQWSRELRCSLVGFRGCEPVAQSVKDGLGHTLGATQIGLTHLDEDLSVEALCSHTRRNCNCFATTNDRQIRRLAAARAME